MPYSSANLPMGAEPTESAGNWVLSGSPQPSPVLPNAVLCPLTQIPGQRRWGLSHGPTQQAVVSSGSMFNKAVATPGGTVEASAVRGLILAARALALLGLMGLDINSSAPDLL